MRDYEKRITATFLSNCSAQTAYDWLSDNSKALAVADVSRDWRPNGERRVLEYLLLRRKDRVVDLGLAQFGDTRYVLRTVFARGNSGIRCAVLANRILFGDVWTQHQPIVDLRAIAKRGERRELEALALNPHLPNSFYQNLLNRTEYFAELDEVNHKFMLMRLGENARLATPYDASHLDGWADNDYNRTFTMAWELTTTVPTTQDWAAVLESLLCKAQGGLKEEEIMPTIERWRIDPPRKDGDSYYDPGYGFYLRSRLADLLKADDNLLSATDFVLRYSFYRRFSPQKYRNWPDFLQKDGEEFVSQAMDNMNLWQIKEERERLSQVAWDTPDTGSDMRILNAFRAREKSFRKEHPDWFYAEDDNYSKDPNAVAQRTEKLLKSIAEKLDALSLRREQPWSLWWK
ncbi:MAG: hypothetical protein ABIP64_18400 [Burkholderiales bacterium]